MSYLVPNSYWTFEYFSRVDGRSYMVIVPEKEKANVLSILYTLREAADDSFKALVTKLCDKNIKYWSMLDVVMKGKFCCPKCKQVYETVTERSK